MLIQATPITAALAGAFSAIVWPMLGRWTDAPGASLSMELVMATLLVIAVPAHVLVVGLGYRHAPGAGPLDAALLKRVGAWLTAAAVTATLGSMLRAA